MKLIPKPEHGSIDWLVGRQKDENGRAILGGSDASALMGASPYRSRADLFYEKTTEPTVSPFNMAFHRGNLLEPALVSEASRILGVDLHTPDVMYRQGRWNINSDAVDLAERPSVNIECKTTTRYTVDSSDDLPPEWKWQGWAQMLVLDCPVFFSVLDSRQNLAVVELERNDHALDLLLAEAESFCQSIDDGTAIEEHLSALSAEQIATLVTPEPTSIELDASALELVAMLENARAMKKTAEDEEKSARDALARLLKEHEIGTLNGATLVTWKQQKGRTSLDTSALRNAHPEIVAQFEREGNPFRVMRITTKKEKA